ncbi:MAG: Xaa-Pro peptidase family protein [Armatimonadota bacterium]|nr:Xaa-Pro peptidase family protein [Armatimonadota bacterium]
MGEIHEIIARQRRAVEAEGWEASVAISPENVAYTAGFTVPSQPVIRHRHAMCVVTPASGEAMVTVDMEFSTARRYSRIPDVRRWKEFTDKPMDLLASTLRELGVRRGRVGIEMHYLPAADYLHLAALMPEVEWVDNDRWFARLRMVKTRDEIDRLRQVGRIADEAHRVAYRQVREGMTERDLGRVLVSELYARGVDGVRILVVASGDRSGLPNAGPTDRVLRRHDLIRVDLIAHRGSYYSDVARTAVVAEPTPQQRDVWQRITDTHRTLLEMIRPGVRTSALYAAFKRKFEHYGFPVSSFVGHGLGLHLHEEPLIGFVGDTELEEDMVLCIEPFIFAAGYGYQVEDEVAVTKTGYALFTDAVGTAELLTTA